MNLLRIDKNKDYLLLPDFVWDGLSDQAQPGVAVYISRGEISQVLPAGSLYDNTCEDMEILQMPGITLMPGLVDCHVHFSMNCEPRTAALDYLNNGVTAVRDGGDKMGIGARTRDSIISGKFPGPVVKASGKAIYRKGKYGSFLGPGINSVEEAIEQIKVSAIDTDQIKIIVSGIVSFKDFGVVGPVQFSMEELQAMVDKSHNLGLRVMAHASSAQGVDNAVAAGVDSIEHGYFLQTHQLEIMAQKKTAWIPTLAPLGNLAALNCLPYEGADIDVVRRSFDLQLIKVKEAHQLGVPIGIGTDAGANQVRHGYSYHEELGFFVAAGLNNHSILKMATSISAEITGVTAEMGTITQGKKPFLIGVYGNPLHSLKVLKKPSWVVMPAYQNYGGEVVESEQAHS
jgi:imidazolonepropionase-like amidohydrolase